MSECEWSTLREEFQRWLLLQRPPAPFSKAWSIYLNSTLHLWRHQLTSPEKPSLSLYQPIQLPLKSEICQPGIFLNDSPILYSTYHLFLLVSQALFVRFFLSDNQCLIDKLRIYSLVQSMHALWPIMNSCNQRLFSPFKSTHRLVLSLIICIDLSLFEKHISY